MFEKIKGIEFSTSSLCDLDCEYCYLSYKEKTKQAVHHDFSDLLFLLKTIELDDAVAVHLTGAEITLCDYDYIADGIKKIRRIEKIKDTKITSYLTTNLSSTDKLIRWMDEGFIAPEYTRISWDGLHSCSKSRLPKNKNYTDETFNENIRRFGQTKHAAKVIVRMAVTKNTVSEMAAGMEFLIDNGYENIEYYFLYNYNEKDFAEYWREELEKIYALRQRKDFNLLNMDGLLVGEKYGCEERRVGCPNLGRKLYVNLDGNIYTCGRTIDNNEAERHCIGHIKTGLNQEQIISFEKRMQERPATITCNLNHCFCCQGDNSLRVTYGEQICSSCFLRQIEKEVFNQHKEDAYIASLEQRIQYGDYKELPFTGGMVKE